MQENTNEILTLTEFKHRTIVQEFEYLLEKNHTLNVVMCMVGWKHEMTPDSVYQIYKKAKSKIIAEIPA